ncbi:MAG: DUF72 domain-containing protein [Desulfobacterales bacterium]|nr:MAG: DUF72 domain-containing protein [Desulfobacterales bacterium]
METRSAKNQQDVHRCRLFVGTSGYSYAEWVEAKFYPSGTKSGNMLPLYVRHFSITELNYTWYQMPRAEAIERQRQKAPKNFLFAAKLTRSLTHEIDSRSWPEHARSYRDGVAPLVQTGQLVAVLIQLPPSFGRTPANRKYLANLLDALYGLPLAIEFRHVSWASDRVFAELERRRITLVGVDEPNLPGLFPALDVVTNPDLFYVRFHGRNAKGWRSGNMQLQFDYSYSDSELKEWIENKIVPMSKQTSHGVLFFNNHVRAQAPENAQRLTTLLKEQGLAVT